MHALTIQGRRIGDNAPCFIIAEAGSNHDRNFEQALQLIDAAKESGADVVKFQVFSADTMAAATQDPTVDLGSDTFGRYGKTLHELYRKVELPREWLPRLTEYAKQRDIMFAATPFDEDAVDALEAIDAPFYKIASYEITHLPLIRYTAQTGKPLILSTGMATIEEIRDAVEAVEQTGNTQYALLHCGVGYPPPMNDLHLAAMDVMREQFMCPIGYSDHTIGLTIPIAAVARGASIYEKHFTLDRNLPGPDHKFALEPAELAAMVRGIRDVEQAIGRPQKCVAESELTYYRRGRRSIFTNRAIKKGDIIKREMLSIVRPALGLLPKDLDRVIGKRARVNMEAFDPVTTDTFDA
ncbi:pseudaminic acid synthase [Candidatus Uhrbacteria bacterium]|nr:pseudaminic acid synthase [Candidatus Uhrbacteria bacterium]